MTYDEMLDRVIEKGLEGVRDDYVREDQKQKLEGAVEGFEACRGRNTTQLGELLSDATNATQKAFQEQSDDYWRIRCREAEIEWVCNCMSIYMMQNGMRQTIIGPTIRAAMVVQDILKEPKNQD